MTPRRYNLWFCVRRTIDAPGQWTAHCLELDVVTQGESVAHALRMLSEACTMTLACDLEAGRDPFERRAPESYWVELYRVVCKGTLGNIDYITTANEDFGAIAGQVEFHVFDQRAAHDPGIPAVWCHVAPTHHASV